MTASNYAFPSIVIIGMVIFSMVSDIPKSFILWFVLLYTAVCLWLVEYTALQSRMVELKKDNTPDKDANLSIFKAFFRVP